MTIRINRFLKKAKREESGFTLIELLVVLVVLAVILAIVVPRFWGTITSANEEADKANKAMLESAAERYYFDNDKDWPDSLDDLVEGDYIKEVPKHAGTDDVWDVDELNLDEG